MTDRLSEDARATVPAWPEELFAFLDDQASLGGHMEKPSVMMLGGSMRYVLDTARGQAVGSVSRMEGKVLGLTLSVAEEVVVRDPPRRKVWRTIGTPRLLIIGFYAMGFEIEPGEAGSRLRVFIDYELPADVFGRLLGRALARLYARWCVRRMAHDAAARFAKEAP